MKIIKPRDAEMPANALPRKKSPGAVPGPAAADSELDRIAMQRWLKADGQRMPLVILARDGKPAVVSDVPDTSASAVVENVEEQVKYLCEFWTGWRARAR